MGTLDYETYCRDTVEHMLRLMGWRFQTPCLNTSPVPKDVRDGVFHTLDHHSDLYCESITQGLTPEQTAKVVLYRDWDQT